MSQCRRKVVSVVELAFAFKNAEGTARLISRAIPSLAGQFSKPYDRPAPAAARHCIRRGLQTVFQDARSDTSHVNIAAVGGGERGSEVDAAPKLTTEHRRILGRGGEASHCDGIHLLSGGVTVGRATLQVARGIHREGERVCVAIRCDKSPGRTDVD